MRRRLPLSRYKPAAYSKQWASYQSPPHSLLKDTVGVDGDGQAREGSISHKVYIDPDHGSELQAQLTKLWQDGKFFDASLEVDGYRLPVHKLVLLAASPYLQSTFRHANPTSHPCEVNLPRETAVGAARDFLKVPRVSVNLRMQHPVIMLTPQMMESL
nr:hypothetical protein BaRGS_034697 [Batillaria attramentaria]